MRLLSLETLSTQKGGEFDCNAAYYVGVAMCATAALSGPIGWIMFGPSCIGTIAGAAYFCD